MSKITDEQLAKLRADNPRGVRLFTVAPEDAGDDAGDDFVFRKIDRATYVQCRGHQKKALVGQGPADAFSLLAKNLLLFPSASDFDALRERAPAICEEFGEELYADADAGLTVREGKR